MKGENRSEIIKEAMEELWNKIIDMQMGNPIRAGAWIEVIDLLKRKAEGHREELEAMARD